MRWQTLQQSGHKAGTHSRARTPYVHGSTRKVETGRGGRRRIQAQRPLFPGIGHTGQETALCLPTLQSSDPSGPTEHATLFSFVGSGPPLAPPASGGAFASFPFCVLASLRPLHRPALPTACSASRLRCCGMPPACHGSQLRPLSPRRARGGSRARARLLRGFAALREPPGSLSFVPLCLCENPQTPRRRCHSRASISIG
jgi:hypothetical protein